MKPTSLLVTALLLVLFMVAIVTVWATIGDRPGPMNLGSSSVQQ